MRPTSCPVCRAPMRPTAAPWCRRCAGCGTWASDLDVDINGATHAGLDEEQRESGLSTLRRRNNETVLDRLAELGTARGARVLDVGSAHGWFVQAARARGLDAQGIEPDQAVAARSLAEGTAVRQGFFPDVLDPDERFDVISFNDVLEHLPDVRAAVAACRRHLAPGGLLSVNIPSNRGAVFRVAALADRVRLHGLSERLWQVGFPSPHLWYFSPGGLSALCADEELAPVMVRSLPSIVRAGLWARAHEDRRPSPVSVAGFAAMWAAAPVLNHPRASDIMHVVARRSADA